jgi:hypothetical protein
MRSICTCTAAISTIGFAGSVVRARRVRQRLVEAGAAQRGVLVDDQRPYCRRQVRA